MRLDVGYLRSRPTILDRSNETLRPSPPSAHFNDGKMSRFALRVNSSLIFFFGGGGGGRLNFLFYSVQDCRTRKGGYSEGVAEGMRTRYREQGNAKISLCPFSFPP